MKVVYRSLEDLEDAKQKTVLKFKTENVQCKAIVNRTRHQDKTRLHLALI